jgi:glycosyltransferase involved in cell wall biosynthesis
MTEQLHVIQTVASIAEWTGGPARTIRDLSEALARQGALVTLVAGHDPARDDALLPPDPALVRTLLVPVDRRLKLPRYDFGGALAGLASADKIILHDNGIWSPANIAAGTAARQFGLPMVISPHGMLDPWAMAHNAGRKKLAWRLYQRRLLSGARGLLATAEREVGPIRALLPGKPVALVPNGVACPPVMPDRSSRDTAIARTILFMSRLHPKKNLPGLIDAWAPLAAQPDFADWTLVIAGPDELDHGAELLAKVRAMGLQRRVLIEGPVPEAAKGAAFATADLFVLPSFSENFGIVVAEALAQGVPAIVSDGAPWQSLASEGCGWWTGTDPASISAALAAAMRLSPSERRQMGERGHAYVQRAFAWDGIAARTLAYYRWLLYGGPMPEFVHV